MLTLRSIERAGPTGEDVRAYPLSYYAATTPTFFNGAALDQDVQADACIIGGGYTGLGAALRLAEAGRSVVLLESGPVGWGASGRNGGQVHLGWNKDQAWLARRLGQDSARTLWTMARTARDDLDRLIALDPDRCDFRPGLIHADHKPGYVAQTHEHVAFMRAEYGHDGLTPLDLADIRALVGSEAYFGGSLDQAGGHLHPLKLALAMARAARDAGAAIHPHSRATALARDGAGWRITTPGGTVRAGQVLVATGGYAQGWFRQSMPMSCRSTISSPPPRRSGQSAPPRWWPGNMRSRTRASWSIISA
jgi:gamma-glutamylputrescine oxidase